jgi:restriction endonuclease S subunit
VTVDTSVTSRTREEPPTGWRIVRFGDVARNVDVNERNPREAGIERYVGLDHLDPESLHIKRWGLVEEGTTFTRKFTTGQVLFGKRRAYQRKAAVAEFDGICSGDILVFEPLDGELIPELLPFIVQSDGFFSHALGTSAGSLSPRTKWKDLAEYEFALPLRDEQRRIAEILWAVDTDMECHIEVVNKAFEVRTACLQDHFHARRSSGEWKLAPLKDFATIQTGLAKGKRYQGQEVIELPYLSVANVQDGYLNLSEVKRIEVLRGDVDRYRLRYNDVLLTEGGDPDKLGRGTIWRNEIETCLHQNHVFCVRAHREFLLPEFLSYQTGSPYGKQYFLRCSKQTTNLATICQGSPHREP